MVDHHFADYSIGLCSELQKSADVALALSVEGLRELTAGRRAALDGLSQHLLYDPRTKKGELKALFALASFFARFRPDVIIVHENGQIHSPILMGLLRLICPVYLIVHDPAPHTGADAVAAKKRAGRIAMERRLASAFIVHGAYCAELLGRQEPRKDIVSIPHGPILTDDDIPAEQRVDGEFLLFGRMQHYKGIDVLVEAFANVVRDHPDLRLRLAGRGPELDRLGPLIASLGDNVVVDREFVTPERLIGYVQRCSAIVLPYRNATQSGVVSAAFANGRTVIVSDVGAIGEFVKDEVNGLLIEPGSVASLESALRRFVSQPDLRARLEEGVRASEAVVSWSVASERLLRHVEAGKSA